MSCICNKFPITHYTIIFKISQCLRHHCDLIIGKTDHCPVTAPAIFLRIFDHACFYRVQMYIPTGLQKIGVLFYQTGFISSLKHILQFSSLHGASDDNCTRKPYSPLSCHNPFVFLLKHIVFYHIVIYDFLQKMRDFLIPSFSPASLLLFEVTDFYVYMLSQGVCIFFQYYKRRNPASALESRQIRWQHSHNVCDLLLSHILAMSFLHQLLNDF